MSAQSRAKANCVNGARGRRYYIVTGANQTCFPLFDIHTVAVNEITSGTTARRDSLDRRT